MPGSELCLRSDGDGCCHPRARSIFKMWAYISLVNRFQDFFISTHFVPASFLMMFIFLLTLASADVILVCCFHVILLSKVTPRYVCCSSILSGVSSKVSLPGWILGESVKRVPVGFSLLMVAHHCSAHVTTLSREICFL